MNMEEYKQLLATAIGRLHKAVNDMEKKTVPNTPMPRAKTFQIAPKTHWPCKDWGWQRFCQRDGSGRIERSGFRAKEICAEAGYQPRKILRALRQIQAATAWCEARTEGRRRAAQEILRQQAAAVEALEAEIAMAALE